MMTPTIHVRLHVRQQEVMAQKDAQSEGVALPS